MFINTLFIYYFTGALGTTLVESEGVLGSKIISLKPVSWDIEYILKDQLFERLYFRKVVNIWKYTVRADMK